MNEKKLSQAASIFKLLSTPTRLRILKVLIDHKELCVNEIADMVASSHSATSHQLARLESFGIVSCYRKGQMICYKISDTDIARCIKRLILFFE